MGAGACDSWLHLSIVRKQRERNAGAQLTFTFYIQSSTPVCEMVPPSFTVVFPTQLLQSRNSLPYKLSYFYSVWF